MVIPVEAPQGAQELMLIEKAADGSMLTRLALPVRFVPLTGKGAEERPRGRQHRAHCGAVDIDRAWGRPATTTIASAG
jgi:hypothetical protein